MYRRFGDGTPGMFQVFLTALRRFLGGRAYLAWVEQTSPIGCFPFGFLSNYKGYPPKQADQPPYIPNHPTKGVPSKKRTNPIRASSQKRKTAQAPHPERVFPRLGVSKVLLGRACRGGSEHPLQVPTRLQWPGLSLRPHEAREQNLSPWELEGCRCLWSDIRIGCL